MPRYRVARQVLRRYEEVWEVETDDPEEIDMEHVDGIGDLVEEADAGLEEVLGLQVEGEIE